MVNAATRSDPLMAYDVWRSMHKRCKDPKTNGYSSYGGRGITVVDRWLVYEYFIADMGPRPTPKHHLDRIDNEGPYSPENCQWITASENERKKDRTTLILYGGTEYTKTDLARKLGFAASSFSTRIRKYGLDYAITHPHGTTGPKPKRS